jgi:hypothetical protein
MRASRALLAAATSAMNAGPPTAPSAALLAAASAPARNVLLCANSTVHGGRAPRPRRPPVPGPRTAHVRARLTRDRRRAHRRRAARTWGTAAKW